jgi:hypothetical protein
MGKPKAEKSGNPKRGAVKAKPQGADLPSVQEPTGKAITTDKPHVKMFGTRNPELQNLFIKQTLMAYGLRDTDKKSVMKELLYVFPAIMGIDPKDELEGMLTVQMVGVHNVAMNCLGRAQLEEQTFEGRAANLKYATRLLQVFTAQMEVLQKNRGKSTQQKVTVEHVHVHQGGQAIVGAVNNQRKGGGGGDDGQN